MCCTHKHLTIYIIIWKKYIELIRKICLCLSKILIYFLKEKWENPKVVNMYVIHVSWYPLAIFTGWCPYSRNWAPPYNWPMADRPDFYMPFDDDACTTLENGASYEQNGKVIHNRTYVKLLRFILKRQIWRAIEVLRGQSPKEKKMSHCAVKFRVMYWIIESNMSHVNVCVLWWNFCTKMPAMIANSAVKSSIRILLTLQFCSQTPQQSLFSNWEEICNDGGSMPYQLG